jgi:LuxR family maltose regulon positive regulatory protein
VLLATKLHVPGSQPSLVPRPRLADQLDEGLGRGLILACAPAGYGKTALLADWVRRGRRPIAWLSLDTADNDPARFWRYVVAALDRACPGIGESIGPLLGPPALPSFDRLLEALINELAARLGGGEALLVLDDYHVISSEPVHSSLRFLLEQRPPRSSSPMHGVHLWDADPGPHGPSPGRGSSLVHSTWPILYLHAWSAN